LGGVSGWFRQEGGYIDLFDPVTESVAKRNSNKVDKFAARAAVLPMHSRRFGSFLGDRGFVDHTNGAKIADRAQRRLPSQALLQPITHAEMIPHMIAQELLKRSHRRAACQRNRLDALACQVREQPATIRVQVLGGRTIGDAVLKDSQVGNEGRAQNHHLLRRHAAPPCDQGGYRNPRQLASADLAL